MTAMKRTPGCVWGKYTKFSTPQNDEKNPTKD